MATVTELRPTRLPPVHKPAVKVETAEPDDKTLEERALRLTGAKCLMDIPPEVARQIVVIDSLDFALTMREKTALLAHDLWVTSGDFNDSRHFLGIDGYAENNALIDAVLDNSQSSISSLKLGDCAKEVNGVEKLLADIEQPGLRDNRDRDKLKALVQTLLDLQGDGLSDEEIIARKEEIREKTRLKPAPRA
jgi:hypothetical protein